jgi:hypothetical protein
LKVIANTALPRREPQISLGPHVGIIISHHLEPLNKENMQPHNPGKSFPYSEGSNLSHKDAIIYREKSLQCTSIPGKPARVQFSRRLKRFVLRCPAYVERAYITCISAAWPREPGTAGRSRSISR